MQKCVDPHASEKRKKAHPETKQKIHANQFIYYYKSKKHANNTKLR